MPEGNKSRVSGVAVVGTEIGRIDAIPDPDASRDGLRDVCALV